MTVTDPDPVSVQEARDRRICAEFPSASDMIYLNTAAEGLGSATLERSLVRYATAKRRGSKGREDLAETGAVTKVRLARWIGCQAEDIGFLGSTTEAINIVLRGLPWQPGDNVVITELEFPGAMIGCLSLTRQFGIDVRVIPHLNGDIDTAAITGQIDTQTRLVILSHVSFYSGVRFDVENIVKTAHEQDALVLVDASQSLGAVDVDVGDVDFLVACPFKWLVASHGLGILYAKPGLEDVLPRHIFGWQGVTDFLAVMRDRDFTPRAGARRFEAGMPTYPAIYALHDSLELLDSLQPSWIEQRVQQHTSAIRDTCCDLGLQVLTPADAARRAGIVAFAHPQAHAIGDALAAQGVIAWYRDGRVRFSPHFYTSDADVRAFRSTLTAVLERLPLPTPDGRGTVNHH